MSYLTWRAAEPADCTKISNLFRTVESAHAVGLESEPSAIRSRLAKPGLRLDSDTLVAIDDGGAIAAYAEAAAMGMGNGSLRIRLTNVVNPAIGDEPVRHAHAWLIERAERIRQEHGPALPAVLGARCGMGDHARLDLLTGSGFEVTDSNHDLVRGVNQPVPVAASPANTSLIPYDPRYGEAARVAHNDAYADSPSAELPDAESSPGHATGLPHFLPEASFLVLAEDAVAAFLFTLGRSTDEGPRATLHCLGTRPAWRNRGLATALISRAVQACQDAGFDEVGLEVRSQNRDAIALYSKLGFRDTGRGYAVLMRSVP